MATLEQIEQAYNSLQTVFRTQIVPEFDRLKQEVANGATLDEVQGRIDALRAEFDSAYSRLESFLAEALTIQPRPDEFIARLQNSLNVNRPTNYQALAKLTQDAGQNQNRKNIEEQAKASEQQGPGTVSTGDTVTEAQAARDEGATTQSPEPQSDERTVPTNADASVVPPPQDINPPPKLDAGVSSGTPTQPTAQTKSGPALGTGTNALQGSAISDTTQTYIYKAVAVTSRFSRGQFTQELEGVLLIFPEDRLRAQSEAARSAAAGTGAGSDTAVLGSVAGTGAGTSVAALTGSGSEQADVRRVDNATAATQTSLQSDAETNRLAAAAGRVVSGGVDQGAAEANRLAAAAGRVASGALDQSAAESNRLASIAAAAAPTINSAIRPFVPAGSTALPGSLASVAGVVGTSGAASTAAGAVLGTIGSLPGRGAGTDALTQAVAAGQSRPASSFGQPVGLPNNNSRGASQGTAVRTVSVQVPLISGGTATVTTINQVLELYNQGRITIAARDTAISQLAAQSAAQQPNQQVQSQSVGYEP